MEQPPAPCAKAQEAMSSPDGVDTFTNASNPKTSLKKKKKKKKAKQKGELVLWMNLGGQQPPPPLPLPRATSPS